VITSTPPASPTALVVKPTLAAQPALTSMAVAARAMTITPSLAPRVRPTGTPAVGEMKIIVGDYYFNPQVVTVTVGTRVSWVPEGVLYHTIVSNDSPPVFRGGTAGLGTRAFERTFRRPGVYKYHCDYHPGAMNAVVVVIENN
jgi:plastocyanin